ncbi:MAG: LUD domain-containing protein [Acidobacteriaceae bacterium]
MTDGLSARSEILARIQSANGLNHSLQNAEQAWQAIPREYRQAGALSAAGCIELLMDRLRDYGAGVYCVETAEIATLTAEILRGRGKKRILISKDVDPAWLTAADCAFVPDDLLSYEEIDRCDGVLTGCTAGIASTGTLALCHGGSSSGEANQRLGQGRRAITLIPDYHLCILQAGDVVETVPEAMRLLDLLKGQPITLVSGPSATADIEMTRIQGVHGPRTLDVVIVT